MGGRKEWVGRVVEYGSGVRVYVDVRRKEEGRKRVVVWEWSTKV